MHGPRRTTNNARRTTDEARGAEARGTRHEERGTTHETYPVTSGHQALGSGHSPRRGTTMRYMMLVKANKDSEAGVLPTKEQVDEMGVYNQKLIDAGVMLAGEGLHATSNGSRVRFE